MRQLFGTTPKDQWVPPGGPGVLGRLCETDNRILSKSFQNPSYNPPHGSSLQNPLRRPQDGLKIDVHRFFRKSQPHGAEDRAPAVNRFLLHSGRFPGYSWGWPRESDKRDRCLRLQVGKPKSAAIALKKKGHLTRTVNVDTWNFFLKYIAAVRWEPLDASRYTPITFVDLVFDFEASTGHRIKIANVSVHRPLRYTKKRRSSRRCTDTYSVFMAPLNNPRRANVFIPSGNLAFHHAQGSPDGPSFYLLAGLKSC